MQYEKRVVCFMDILGFKSMILNSANDAGLRDRIYECLNETKRINEHFKLNKYQFRVVPAGAKIDSTKVIDTGITSEMSFFSDSIILSYKMDQMRDDLMDLMLVLYEIGCFAFNLACMDFFVRGGLTYGDVVHKGNLCFGPALVKAVALEGKAVHPRISVCPSFFDENSPESVYYGRKNLDVHNKNVWEDRYHCVDTSTLAPGEPRDIRSIRHNYNLIHYLDFLDHQIDGDETAALYLKAIIEKELKAGHPAHIAEKYEWFRDYFNSVVYNVQCMEKAKIDI